MRKQAEADPAVHTCVAVVAEAVQLVAAFEPADAANPARQQILRRRALDGTHPQTQEEIIAWLKAVATTWNRDSTPFVWGGKRVARRAPALPPP